MRKNRFENWKERYNRWMEGKGFALLVTLCVALIAGTAVWTKRDSRYVSPTPPVSSELSASALMQEHLPPSATPTPLPTSSVQIWHSPLDVLTILRPYSDSKMFQSDTSGIWRVHQALDLKSDAGSPIYAIADGTVISSGSDPLEGTWIEISHANGYCSRYSSLSAHGAFKKGDRVRAGQTIGFVGTSNADEGNLGAHLHLELRHNGQLIDPEPLMHSTNIPQ